MIEFYAGFNQAKEKKIYVVKPSFRQLRENLLLLPLYIEEEELAEIINYIENDVETDYIKLNREGRVELVRKEYIKEIKYAETDKFIENIIEFKKSIVIIMNQKGIKLLEDYVPDLCFWDYPMNRALFYTIYGIERRMSLKRIYKEYAIKDENILSHTAFRLQTLVKGNNYVEREKALYNKLFKEFSQIIRNFNKNFNNKNFNKEV